MSVGLVLEGGGTRGAYTSGVLDVFSENEIQFRNIYGVSAGACNALSYISGQTKRNFDIFYHYLADPRYLSVKSLRKTGSILYSESSLTTCFPLIFRRLTGPR